MKVIFLDIDGVLNTPSSESRCGEYIGIDDEKVENLKKIVENTKAEIVLISTWKKYWRKEKKLKPLQDYSANYLDEKLAKQGLKAVDKTKDKSVGRYLSRGESVLEYVCRNSVENYIILDDCQFDYDGCGIADKLVKTKQIEGLTEKEVKTACRIMVNNIGEQLSIILREENGKEFLAAVGEDIESVRPDYNFKETQNALDEIETKMRKLKHALNVFNSTTVIPEFGMTIDEMLVYIPQLTMRKNKLAGMKDRLPKVREQTRVNSSILDYRYLNYGVDEATAEYDKIADTLAKAQNALDAVNMSEILEVDL